MTSGNTSDDPATAVRDQFPRLLEAIGIRDDERVSIAWQKKGGSFESTVPITRADALDLAAAHARGRRNVWFGVCPVELPTGYVGRGTAEHVTRLPALWLDLDIKAGGLPDLDACRTVVDAVSEALSERPAATVETGHGLHAYWQLDGDDPAWTIDTPDRRSAAAAVLRRFHRLGSHVAEHHGGRIDNVHDLARVLRVPGSLNIKDEAPLPVMLREDTGGPLTFEQVIDAFDAYGVAEVPEDIRAVGEEVLAPSSWVYGETTSPYVAGMVDGWKTDEPKGRHQWLVSQCTRLHSAHRAGAITEDDMDHAQNVLVNRFRVLLSHPSYMNREEAPGELAGAWAWARTCVAAKTDAEVLDEIGGPGRRGDDIDALALDPGRDVLRREVPQLPESFWERPVHRHIQDAAWSRMQAPLPLLGVVLARLGALLGPGVRVDTGIKSPLPLHVFLALCGASGTGKSAAISAGRRLSPDLGDVHPLAALGPMSGTTGDVADAADLHDSAGVALVEFPLGSGEGLAEAFWGSVEKETSNGKVRIVRRQIRQRVLFTADEGGSLTKQMSREGSTTGEALRSAWAGEPIGQKNGRAETTRYVAAGEYALGLVMGIQTGPACELLTDREYGDGTPQRFLFVPAITNWLPEDSDRPDDPGPVRLAGWPTDNIRLCAELRTRVAGDDRARTLGEVESPVEESHRPAYVARLAALLGILDRCSRGEEVGEITTEDWELADQLFDLSLTMQRNIRQEGARAAEADRTARARSRGRAQVEQEDAAAEKRVKRAMQAILRAAGQKGGARRPDIHRRLRSDIRDEFEHALAILTQAGDVIVREDDTIEVPR